MNHATASPDAIAQDPPLGRPERQFIVLLAMVQGLLLYLAQKGMEEGWWLFAQMTGRVGWYTLVLAVPGMLVLSVRRLGEPRLWQHAAGVLVLYALLAWWAAWSATGPDGVLVQAGEVLGPFGATLALGSFVALPYLQVRLADGRWHAPYPRLFEFAWQNGLTLALAGLFVGLGWSLLMLWAALFKLIGVRFFADLFAEDPFIYLATGLLFGLGVLIGRTQQRAVRIARQVLFALFTGLLPVLVLVALLFLGSLPFTGLESLWDTRSATATLALVLAHLVLFLNAVWQDGQGAPPYPRWLQALVRLGLVLSPVFAGLAAVALWLRIGQYGLTVDRFWASLAVALLAAYAIGYALAALRRAGQAWLPGLARVNVLVSLALVALALLANSPLLDPYRASVSSQLARVDAADDADLAEVLDVEALRWELGRRGVLALQQLAADPRVQADTALAAEIGRALEATSRYGGTSRRPVLADTVPLLRKRIALAPGAEPLDDAYLQALLDERLPSLDCRAPGADCLALSPDADGDGVPERLLCDLGINSYFDCVLATRRDDGWQPAGSLQWWLHQGPKDAESRLRAGEVATQAQCWRKLSVGGLPFQAVEGEAAPPACTSPASADGAAAAELPEPDAGDAGPAGPGSGDDEAADAEAEADTGAEPRP